MSESSNSPSPIPFTLLTGFLGAGKTTLLNAVLSDASTGRAAVIVNEFGEAGLDHDLIEAVENEVVLMQSGCLCCSIRGDLAKTIERLLLQREAGEIDFDRVVVETTGLADPGPILQTFATDPMLRRETTLDGVVTVFDAANGPGTLGRQFEAVSQVALADLIILSKTDLVSEAEANAAEARLRSINPTGTVVRASHGAFDHSAMWKLTGLRPTASMQEVIGWTKPLAAPDPLSNLTGMAPKTSPQATFTPHDQEITSVSIELEEPLDDVLFDRWFDTLIAFKGRDILRVKGILFLKGIDTPFAFHGVQHVFDAPVPITSWNRSDRRTRIVLIGRNLNGAEIQRSLDLLRLGQPEGQIEPSYSGASQEQF